MNKKRKIYKKLLTNIGYLFNIWYLYHILNKYQNHMGFIIIDTDKTYTVPSTAFDSSHIGYVYGGLKDGNNSVTGNLSSLTFPITATNSGGWCTVTLNDVDSTNTAVKLYVKCSANTTTSDRTCTVLLLAGSNISHTKVTIVLLKKSGGGNEYTDEYRIIIPFLNNNIYFRLVYIESVACTTDPYRVDFHNSTCDFATNEVPGSTTGTTYAYQLEIKFKKDEGLPVYTTSTSDDISYIKFDDTNIRIYVLIKGNVTAHAGSNTMGYDNASGIFKLVFKYNNRDDYQYFILGNLTYKYLYYYYSNDLPVIKAVHLSN